MSGPNRMTCEDAFRRLDDYLDRALSEEETRRLEEHLAICAACASEFAWEASELSQLRSKLNRVQMPPDLMEKIRTRLAGPDIPPAR